jgi:hypothetical protein
MLYVMGFFVIFVIGGMTGVMLAMVPFDLQAHDTHFVVAHLHYVLIGGFVFPMMAAPTTGCRISPAAHATTCWARPRSGWSSQAST